MVVGVFGESGPGFWPDEPGEFGTVPCVSSAAEPTSLTWWEAELPGTATHARTTMRR